MTTLEQAARQALGALQCHADIGIKADKQIADLRQALEQPKREWVGLPDEEIRAIDTSEFWDDHTPLDFARAIEAKLKELNQCNGGALSAFFVALAVTI